MDKIDLFWKSDELHIIVNGCPLQELIAVIERPFAVADGHPDAAGGYAGLRSYSFGNYFTTLADHFMGGEHSHLFVGPKDRTVLLVCDCGEPGAWALMARVTAADDEMVWSDFYQPRRKHWDYGAFQARFDRAEYEAALDHAGELPER